MHPPSLFSPQAWQDALEIIAYITADNPEVAARFLPALKETCMQLVSLPGIGSVRTFQHTDLQGVRMLPVTGFENYIIFYTAAGTRIEVLRICIQHATSPRFLRDSRDHRSRRP